MTSPSNGLLKAVRKAVSQGTTTPEGYSVAETMHLLEEALRSNCVLGTVLSAESARDRVERALRGKPEIRLAIVSDPLLDRLSATETSQGVLTLVRLPEWRLDDVFRHPPLVVVLDGVQDPGNVGAIIRSAEAFGASGVALLKGCASPNNPKVIRASAGSIFRVPVVAGLERTRLVGFAAERQLAIHAAMPSAGIEAPRVDFSRGCAIIIGGEGRGLRADLYAAATPVRIPTAGVESLNAAMAASILLYEARRQRGSA